jgi:hypothetical protein
VEAHERVKRSVQFTRGAADENHGKPETLQVVIGPGIRITGIGGEEPPVYVEIEADFLTDYEITSAVSEDAIKAFASFSAVHNVWPFWRQHVFDVVQRARLQQIQIPLFSGTEVGGRRITSSFDRSPWGP